MVGESGKVYAFEPAADTFAALDKNLALNQIHNVQAFRIALSDTTGQGAIKVPTGTPEGFSDAYKFIDYSESRASEGSGEQVELVSLDDFALKHGIRKVDFLKVDVEGTQLNVFKGARRVLSENPHCTILFECPEQAPSIPQYRQQDSFDLLISMGFQILTWDAAGGPLKDIGQLGKSSGNFVALRAR